MTAKLVLVLAAAVALLSACSSAPGTDDVQVAVQRLGKSSPMMFGSDKPIVKDASCTKIGNRSYRCVTAMAVTSAPTDVRTVTVMMTQLDGQWTAQIPNILQ
jgi:hypothetical protein